MLQTRALIAKVFGQITNVLPYIFAAYLVWIWAPVAWRNFGLEGKTTAEFAVKTLAGEVVDSSQLKKPVALVFWATWCAPCTLELRRIQRLIDQGKIPAHSIFAMTQEQDVETVRSTVKERGYSFPIGIDSAGELFRRYNVASTPTVVVINKQNSVAWISSGLSPTLELRLRSHLKEE